MSLRTLLLLMLGVGCVLGLITRRSRQAHREAEILRELPPLTGHVAEYCDIWGRNGEAPAWQTRLLGEHYFKRVVRLTIAEPAKLPQDGRLLGELVHLRTLVLERSNAGEFTDRHAAGLAPLRKLETARRFRRFIYRIR